VTILKVMKEGLERDTLCDYWAALIAEDRILNGNKG
jgi:hypothetical protein